MKHARFFRFLQGPVLALCLFAGGCKDTTELMDSPLSPPAWIQGSWADQGYSEKSLHGSRWEFTQDNAISYDYMYGLPHLAPWNYYQFYLDCLSGKYNHRYELSDLSSDTYYEIKEIFVVAGETAASPRYLKFIKLTPTTFHFKIMSSGSLSDYGIYTKE